MFKLKEFKLALFVLSVLMFAPLIVLAQEVGVLDDPAKLVKLIVDLVGDHNIPAAIVLVLVLVTWGLRKLPIDWFKSSVGGTVLALATAISTTLGGAVIIGQPVTKKLVWLSVGAGFTAIGAWTGVRRLLRGIVENKAVKTFLEGSRTGKIVLRLLVYASGSEVKGEVLKLTQEKFDSSTPAAAADVAKELDAPPVDGSPTGPQP